MKLKQIVYILAFLITFGVSKQYPSVALQWGIAYVSYWLGVKLIKYLKINAEKQNKFEKTSIVLGVIGLVGLISPILGFPFALIAYLLAEQVLDKNNTKRKSILIFTAIVLGICITNANIGAMIYNQGNQ